MEQQKQARLIETLDKHHTRVSERSHCKVKAHLEDNQSCEQGQLYWENRCAQKWHNEQDSSGEEDSCQSNGNGWSGTHTQVQRPDTLLYQRVFKYFRLDEVGKHEGAYLQKKN